jgi:hypothetical protein
VKLTTTKLFVGLFVVTVVAVIAGLLWMSSSEQDDQTVRGPARLISKMRQRQKQLAVEEARSNAQALENATHDLGLSGAATK